MTRGPPICTWGRGGVRSVYSAEAPVLPVPLLALETLDILAASLPPASLRGQGLHLRHAIARDRTRRRALRAQVGLQALFAALWWHCSQLGPSS